MLRIGIDVGGTFTDLFVYDEECGGVTSAKVLTTPQNQALGVMQALEAGHVDLKLVSFIAHGSTTGTNALIERKGAVTGLLTTEGFRDVLEIMRTDRQFGYDLGWHKPRPLVPRRLRREVAERVDKEGSIEIPLDEEHARKAIRALIAVGVESVAVCFLHSYANPAHERRVAELIKEESPDLCVSLSSDINAEYREYERSSTVVIDAYIKPVMASYTRKLVGDLVSAGLNTGLFMMQGSGGMTTAARVAEKPSSTISSGPAAGAIAAAKIGAQAGLSDIVTFDVGGTSTDVSLIHDGKPFVNHQKAIEWGMPCRVPMIDIESVGAGGGSIGWIDQGGALKMGPQSSGADPGPICYGRGGTEPTLSDALLLKGVLGRSLAGGRVRLDEEAAHWGVLRQLADPLMLSVDRVVAGMVEIAEANMANAVRSVSIWKGLDPRDLTLVAFGGAGGMMAGSVARALDIPRLLIPMFPGNTCAMGLLMTDMQEDATVAYLARADSADLDAVNSRLSSLRDSTSARLVAQGVPVRNLHFTCAADVRYHGQIHELTVPFDEFPVTSEGFARTLDLFESMYQAVYTIRLEGGIPELTSLRATSVGEANKYALGDYVGGPKLEAVGRREVLDDGDRMLVDVFERYSMPIGTIFNGPAIIEEPGSTIWITSGMTALIDDRGNLLIDTKAASRIADSTYPVSVKGEAP